MNRMLEGVTCGVLPSPGRSAEASLRGAFYEVIDQRFAMLAALWLGWF